MGYPLKNLIEIFRSRELTAIRLGLRYERLLLFAGPISFATLIVLFVAIASVSQKERYEARCFESAVETITHNKETLQAHWDKVNSAQDVGASQYKLQLNFAWIDSRARWRLGENCYNMIDQQLGNKPYLSPSELIDKFQLAANLLKNTPLQFYDVEIPDKANVNILGTNVKIGLMTFTQSIQVALAPLLLLWLGSVYSTRLRESFYVGTASKLSEVFPHSVNIYPSGSFPQLRKRNFFLFHLPKAVALTYGLFRMASLSVFIAPPVISYILSLYFLHIQEYTLTFIILGALVFTAGFMNLILELCPWHYWKIFADSVSYR